MKKTLLFLLFVFLFGNVHAAEPGGSAKEPNIYFAYRSFNPELATMKTFHGMGVDTICFFPANTLNSLGNPYSQYPPLWLGINRYDFVSLDKQIEDIVLANPDAKLLCMIDLNTPPWLTRRFAFDSFSEISVAACNSAWLDETSKYLEAFLKHAEEKHGQRIVAYILSGGGTSEWYEYNRGRGSRGKNNAWRQWCQKNGMPTQSDPPSVSRLDHASFENFLYDPVKDFHAAAYWRFHNETIVDAMLHFARKTRTIIPPGKEIGFFFGYIFVAGPREVGTFGHLDYERIYAAKDVDFFISPGNYADRMTGGGSGPQLMLGTLQLRGKRYLHETDHRTSTTKIGVGVQSKSQDADTAMLKREAYFALINHASMWWFDMWGGYYVSPETLELLQNLRKIWEQWKNDKSSSIAEVLLVADPQSAYHINEMHPDSGKVFNGTQNKLNRLGAPYDAYSFNDLSEMDLSRYKLIVFPGTFLITPERAEILEKFVLKNNRTIMWCRAPGVIDGKTLNPEFMQRWTGVKYGTTDIQRIKKENWTSVYVPTYDALTPEMLKEAARKAGVTIYCNEKVPVFANERLLAIHTAEGGKQTVTLPFMCEKIVDLYTGKIVAENCRQFEFEFRAPDTVLFEMQKTRD